jgi:hypothetical protein
LKAIDAVGLFAKYAPPTIANGKVYVPTFGYALEPGEIQANTGQVIVYGLQPKRTVRSSGYLIQSNYGIRGNFELIVPKASGGMMQAERSNDNGNSWRRTADFGSGPVGAVSLVQSNFSPGGGTGNLELLTRVGNGLLYYWKSDEVNSVWQGPLPVPISNVAGTPAMIHGRFGVTGGFGKAGDFELVVPRAGGGLAHYARHNDINGLPWSQRAPDFAQDLNVSAVSMIQSSFSAGAGIGNLELIGRVADRLALFWKPDTPGSVWQGTQVPTYFASGVSGTPSLIQGRFGHVGDFEVVVPLAKGGLGHYTRDNDNGLRWSLKAEFGAELGQVTSVSLIQSNFSDGAGIGNLELVAVANGSYYYFSMADTSRWTWRGPVALTP